MRRRLCGGGKRPWRGFGNFEHGHERMADIWHCHGANGKEGRGGKAWRAIRAHRARRVAASHHGTGTKGHAHGTQEDPEHYEYAGDPSPAVSPHELTVF